jgi:hypothetical protein
MVTLVVQDMVAAPAMVTLVVQDTVADPHMVQWELDQMTQKSCN